MTMEVRCPRCGQVAERRRGCQHLRWVPERGGPVEFAQHVVKTSPYTGRRGFSPGDIPSVWWESHHDWLLERILARLDVIDGYCFADPADLDHLCLDIWHLFAPETERAGLPRGARP